MAISTGFRQQYAALGLDSGSLVLYFDFNESGTNPVPNFGNTNSSGLLGGSTGNFYQNSGSGLFNNTQITITSPQNISGNLWTHVFVLEKSHPTGGVLFDSFQSGSNGIFSGILIGINDNHKLFFEHYDNFGPAVYTSNIILPRKACVAVTRANNTVSFHSYDFNQQELISEAKTINGQYLLPSLKANLGAVSGAPNYISYRNYNGYIDDYVYIKDSIIPAHLEILMSGFVSSYDYTTGIVTYDTGIEITGYSFYLTGITGVLSSGNIPIASGYDVFGDFYVTYSTTGITGYLTSGSGVAPLTGYVITTSTGDPISTFNFNSGFAEEFKYDEISYLRQIDSNDLTSALLLNNNKRGLNQLARYDFVEGSFELPKLYQDAQIQPYLNGVSQLYTGQGVTGTFYNSGAFPSGAYYLDDFYIRSATFYASTDTLICDELSGSKGQTYTSGSGSGITESLTITNNSLVFLNGQLLVSGFHYIKTGNNFRWFSNIYSGATGYLTTFEVNYNSRRFTGIFPQTGNFPRESSMIWLNGQRQRNEIDYVENSTADLVRQSGIFNAITDEIYNNNDLYWQ